MRNRRCGAWVVGGYAADLQCGLAEPSTLFGLMSAGIAVRRLDLPVTLESRVMTRHNAHGTAANT